MSTLSVPLTKQLEAFIDEMVRLGIAPNKAEVVRKALHRYAEDQAVDAILRSEQEARDGKVIKGDLRKILKKMP